MVQAGGMEAAPCSVAAFPCSGFEREQRPSRSAPRRPSLSPAHPSELAPAHLRRPSPRNPARRPRCGSRSASAGRSFQPQAPSLGGSPRPTLRTDSQMSLPLDALSCLSFPGCPSGATGSRPLGTPHLDAVSSAFCPSLPSVCLCPGGPQKQPTPQVLSGPLPGALSLGETATPGASPAKRSHP